MIQKTSKYKKASFCDQFKCLILSNHNFAVNAKMTKIWCHVSLLALLHQLYKYDFYDDLTILVEEITFNLVY